MTLAIEGAHSKDVDVVANVEVGVMESISDSSVSAMFECIPEIKILHPFENQNCIYKYQLSSKLFTHLNKLLLHLHYPSSCKLDQLLITAAKDRLGDLVFAIETSYCHCLCVSLFL